MTVHFIGAGPGAADLIDITAPVAVNINRVAKAKGGKPSDVTVVILDRPRHADLVRRPGSTPGGNRPDRTEAAGAPPGHDRIQVRPVTFADGHPLPRRDARPHHSP